MPNFCIEIFTSSNIKPDMIDRFLNNFKTGITQIVQPKHNGNLFDVQNSLIFLNALASFELNTTLNKNHWNRIDQIRDCKNCPEIWWGPFVNFASNSTGTDQQMCDELRRKQILIWLQVNDKHRTCATFIHVPQTIQHTSTESRALNWTIEGDYAIYSNVNHSFNFVRLYGCFGYML